MNTAGTDEIADLLISEIRDGMYEYDPADPFKVQSNIRAGIIKIATGEEGPDRRGWLALLHLWLDAGNRRGILLRNR